MRGRGMLDALCDLTGRGQRNARGQTDGGTLGMGTGPGAGTLDKLPSHHLVSPAEWDLLSRPFVSPEVAWRPGPLCPLL